MKNTIFKAVMLIFLLSVADALDFNNMQNYAIIYNENMEKSPDVLQSMIGNESVEFTILLNNNSTLLWGMELEKAKIVRSGYGGLENATIEVDATEDSLNKVLHAEDHMAAYREAERSGQMKIDGKTFRADIKITVALGMGSLINSFIGSLL